MFFLLCARRAHVLKECKSPNPPGDGKDLANGKGVVGDDKSEGSRMAKLWSDEQKPYMRLGMRVRLQYKLKPNNHTESCLVDMADRWSERTCEYPGRSVWNALKGVTTAQGNEAVLSIQKSAEVILAER